jgi:hypothetical protein
MNNKNLEVSCLTGWSASVPEENLMPMALVVREKMLHTSKLYLKAEATQTEFDSKAHQRTDHLSELLLAH